MTGRDPTLFGWLKHVGEVDLVYEGSSLPKNSLGMNDKNLSTLLGMPFIW